jgi:ABC-type antimicrobial peptide transport system permease subunit
MADFHLASVRTAIHPMVFQYGQKYGYVMHVALSPSPDNWKKAIAKMQLAWRAVYPDQDFDYQFLDKTIQGFYQQEQQLSKLLSWAAGVAILISCLGLLGLVIFTANQRIKEIGIRKVLGASVAQIIALLSKDFVRLVAIAFVIAVPFAWWATHQWLQNFAYHTELSWWIFAIGGITMLAIALLILSLRAGRAAMANPVNSLRTE